MSEVGRRAELRATPPAPARTADSEHEQRRQTRNESSHYGSVLKTQQRQVYVDLDDGRKVWVAEELVTLA